MEKPIKLAIIMIIVILWTLLCIKNCPIITDNAYGEEVSHSEQKIKDYKNKNCKENKERAIYLAKNSYALFYFTKDRLANTDMDYTTANYLINEQQIIKYIRRLEGPILIFGWEVIQYNDQTFIVTYSFTNEDEKYYYHFDVNLKNEIVRFIPKRQLMKSYPTYKKNKEKN